jgi:lysophospholipase L1-like esterase
VAGRRAIGRRRRAGRLGLAPVLALAALAACGGPAATPHPACTASTWVGAWSADPSDAQNPGLADQTVRTILTPALGDETLRVRLSNRFGAGPVRLDGASVALRQGTGAALAPGSIRPLTFAGATAVTLPTGEDVVSDPVTLHVTPAGDLAVSLFAAGLTGPATEHAVGQQTSYVSPPGSGDHVGETSPAAFTLTTKARYPDLLARRLAAEAPSRRLSVVNAGIGGNRLLGDGQLQMAGRSALARLDTDAIGAPGASDAIVLEGINDIAHQATAAQVIAGLGRIVARLHAAGLGVQLGTLTPFGGSAVAPVAEAERLQINRWVRGGGGADGTVDFDAAVRDPRDPGRLDPRYDSGDHLHPNAAGRRALAGAVDLTALRGATCQSG